MSFPTELDFKLDELDNFHVSSCTITEVAKWQISVGEEIKCSGDSSQDIFNFYGKSRSSANISLIDVIDDSIARKKLWEKLFGNALMPSPEKGTLDTAFGLLDSCFAGKNLTSEDVLEILKKAK
jgi:hypothetical protein